ncbi:myotilin isoform X2 [Triplophysa dalaica]|uniref:myotilin isoform X2 n=1 Tax=Triplophysa dalaica TaxID=1582913 RepID=UPI0024E0371B|nr:myotilin isoform X2 [Triplophysa dalaica]
MAEVQKKTSTMSLTISSCSRETSSSSSSSSSSTTVLQQRHSSLVHPVCISPQMVQSSAQCSGNTGVSPTFVKCLHDVSTVKGQLVVLECRIRGTPPLHMSWYREDQQIIDSADFRILRKKASSASVPEELCTLVITEAYPEDSGMFQCTASNHYGSVSCSAVLEVYTDLEEVMGDEDVSSAGLEQDDLAFIPPPPEWPDSSEEESTTPLAGVLEPAIEKVTTSLTIPESERRSTGQPTAETTAVELTPKHPPPSKEVKNSVPHPFLPASKLSKPVEPRSSAINMADLPTFTPTLYPPSAFNYERPRHFIQSQSSFHMPNNDINKPNHLSSPTATAAPSVIPAQPAPARTSMCSSVTIIPKVRNTPNSEKQSSAAFLSSVLPSLASAQPKCISVHQSPSPRRSPMSLSPPPKIQEQPPPPPSQQVSHTSSSASSWTSPDILKTASPLQSPPVSHVNYTPNILPKPILKKTVSRPASRATDEQIQGSKDALIQDLEKKLKNKVPQHRNSQKMSYEERMARRLLGPDSAASAFELDNSFGFEQPGSPEGHHPGGIWSRKHHSGGDGTEVSTIQEKCFAPRFVQVPQDLTVEEGRFCRIDFKVVALPTPDISWYLDGKPIRPDDYHKMLVCEKSVHSFIIEIVTVHHVGVYECVAKNRAGESRFSLRLDVIAQEQLCPPTFVVKMRNSRALEGDLVRLECKVTASPTPQIYWKKDKEMLRIDPIRMSHSQDGSGTQCLLIDPVLKSDAGWYTVSAINEAGMSTCNARLDVGSRLNKTGPPPKPVKMLPMISQFSTLSTDAHPRHTAPLYESEEL